MAVSSTISWMRSGGRQVGEGGHGEGGLREDGQLDEEEEEGGKAHLLDADASLMLLS